MGRNLKPIKIKKKDKSCNHCKKFDLYKCSLSEDRPPVEILNSGCKRYKKNKNIYF